MDSSKLGLLGYMRSLCESSDVQRGLLDFKGKKVSNAELEVFGYDPISGFQYVGMEEATSAKCGKLLFLNGCSDVEAHKGVVVDGVDCTGKSFVQKILHSCDKATCKVCVNSWKVRFANQIGSRLFALSKRFGKIEHITVSVPPKDYGLPYAVLRRKAEDVALSRGVSGNMIVHAFRGHSRKSTKFSIHFHVMGFVDGGFDRCRSCVHKRGDCKACDGFKGRQVRGFAKDGYIVKVLTERKSVYAKYLEKDEKFRANVVGTLVYELGHATVLRGVKRFHVSVWFGKCAYNNAKVDFEVKKRKCPICGKELGKIFYSGSLPLVAFKLSGGVKECSYDTVEDDKVVFVEAGSSGYSSSFMKFDGG